MRSRFGNVKKLLQIAATVFIKHDAFVFEHELLFVVWQNDVARRTLALRVDHAMPRRAVRRGVHAKTNGARRIAVAEQLGDLAVSHHAARRNTSHDLVNALAICWVFFIHRLRRCSQNHARRSAVAFVAS